MGLFTRNQSATVTAVPAPSTGPVVAAAVGNGGRPSALGQPTIGAATERALSVPTISRARDLIVALVGSLDLRQFTLTWSADEQREVVDYVRPASWVRRPDPAVTRNFLLANTTSDLFFHGRAFWYVTSRYASGFPATFQWLPADSINTPDQSGPSWAGPSPVVQYAGITLDHHNVVQFLSPIDGLLSTATRSLDIAIRLDTAARRFATNEIAAGYLQQTGGEPMSGDELGDLAAGWSKSRGENAVGALNEFVKWVEFSANPSTLQLVEGRQHAALELARVANIPAYLVGVPVGGMTYQNAQQARQDLYLFGAKPFVSAIAETLSSDQILPRGQQVAFDVDAYLREASINPSTREPLETPATPDTKDDTA